MIYEMRIYRCVPGRLPALLKRFETVTLKLWEKHGIKQAGFFTTLIGESNQELTYFLAWDSARRPRSEVGQVHDRPGLDEGACRERSGRPDRRQHRQPAPDADRLLGGEVSRRRKGLARNPGATLIFGWPGANGVDPTLMAAMVAPKRGTLALSSSNSAAPVVTIGTVRFGNDLPISIIAGPCQLESRQHALEVASALREIAARLKIGLVYKTSFDKANRTSASAARGLGLAQSLPIFAEIRASSACRS